MNYIRNSQTKFVAAAVTMFVMAIIASRQFYLSLAVRGQQSLPDPQVGRYHLWFAAGAALLASIAACLMFLFSMGHEKSKRSKTTASPLEPQPALINVSPDASSPMKDHFNALRWEQLNEWCVEGQSDDRRPMNGGFITGLGPASAERADARLAHQGMYKKWARERHD